MVTSVTAKSNHYETLGLQSTATTEEIGKAYAAQMTTFRLRPENALTRLAMLSTAYETLRDPAKRRAYDTSLGLNTPPPAPEPVVAQRSEPFIGATTAPQFNRPRPAPAPQRPTGPTRRPEPDPRVGSFIAASLRQPPPKSAPVEWPVQRPVEAAEPAPVYDELMHQEEHARIHKNQAMIGAGIIGLAILGIATAIPRPNVDRLTTPTTQPQQAVTVSVPPATPAQDTAIGTPAEASAKAPAARQQVPVETAAQTVETPSTDSTSVDAPQPAQAATQQAAADPLAPVPSEAKVQPASDSTVTDSAVQAAPAATKVAAVMPLANATIANIIRRIGYSCGSVASTEATGAAGVFKVTCSSGDSYQATPLHGRYHFRRLGSH